MSRKKTEINPIRAERVKKLIEREKISQVDFASRIFQTQQNVSRILNLKTALTEETARDIVTAFPEYNVSWLLGDSDFMLKEDLRTDYIQRSHATDNACLQILDSALREVCAREGIEIPTIDNTPEILLLQGQLRDFADSLMWNYVRHREHSHFWGTLDQELDTIERKLKK
jgi:transcriptional regulator with XRE-family HTH domain